MFQKATRKQAKLKLAVTGPSGSGKTYSALMLAKGIGGKIALIDTENKSASLYADSKGMPEFDTLDLGPPYTTIKYLDAMNAAVKAGYDVLIIDSGTHQWAGDGGILSRKEKLDQKPGSNSYTNWGQLTPEQEGFKASILQAPIHMIMTLRSKQDYVLEKNEKGKSVPVKVGMAPIQRDGLEYEFSTVFDADMSHNVTVSKDRSGLFDGQYFRITEETGKTLGKWLSSGDKDAPKLSPDEFIVSGKLNGKKISVLEIGELDSWAKNAAEYIAKLGDDPEKSGIDMARSYRAVKRRIAELQPSMFEAAPSGGLNS